MRLLDVKYLRDFVVIEVYASLFFLRSIEGQIEVPMIQVNYSTGQFNCLVLMYREAFL